MQNMIVNINGKLFAPNQISDQAKVGVFDRGYMYGDSLYEVARTYEGHLFALDEHLTRLEESAKLCRMVLTQPLSQYRQEMTAAVDAFRRLPGCAQIEAYCRIIVSRGIGKIGFGLNCVTSPSQYVIIVQPLDPPTAAQYEKGFRYQVVKRLRNSPKALDPAMKSGNYLNSLLAYLEAAAEDFDDALMCNADGHMTEGTTFNVFYVKRGIVCTSTLDIGILDGITRRMTIEVAGKLGIPVRQVRFPKERLYEADEVFMTSTIKEVFPVSKVDGHVIAGGKPGPITRKLTDAFRKEVAQWLATQKDATPSITSRPTARLAKGA